jgi:hypothetical protein
MKSLAARPAVDPHVDVRTRRQAVKESLRQAHSRDRERDATFTRPSTGNRTLDATIDRLAPDAKVAIVAFLERQGTDAGVGLVYDRLTHHVEDLRDPDILTTICQERDDPQMEVDAEFWMAYRDAWKAAMA